MPWRTNGVPCEQRYRGGVHAMGEFMNQNLVGMLFVFGFYTSILGVVGCVSWIIDRIVYRRSRRG